MSIFLESFEGSYPPTNWTTSSANITQSTSNPFNGTHNLNFSNTGSVIQINYGVNDGNSGNVIFSGFVEFLNVDGQIIFKIRQKEAVGTAFGSLSAYLMVANIGAGFSLFRQLTGTQTALGSTVGSSSTFVQNTYYYIEISANGSAGTALKCRAMNTSTGTWLNSSGAWVTDATNSTYAITQTDSNTTLDGQGFAGIAAFATTGHVFVADYLALSNFGSLSLTCSPTTGSTTDSSTTLAITPTLTGSTASLASAVAGGGTISTTTPTSGTSLTYTPPTSGTGTGTVTFTAPAHALVATSNVTFLTGNDFSIAASPGTISMGQGSTATSTITLTRAGSYTGTATYTVTGLPTGVSASIVPGSNTGNATPQTAVCTFTALNSASVGGPTTVTITATDSVNSLVHTTTVAVTVTAVSNVEINGSYVGGSPLLNYISNGTQ